MKESANISDFICRFIKEAPKGPRGKGRKGVMKLFNDYLANYGEIESNVERDPLIVTAPISELKAWHFRNFLSWFIIRKVLDPGKGQYAPILREFAEWLKASGVVNEKVHAEMIEALDELKGEPERCEKLSELLYRFANRDMPTSAEWREDPKAYARKAEVLKAIHHKMPQKVLDGHFTIARVGPGVLWLTPENVECDDDSEEALEPAAEIGPVQVGTEAAKLARVGDGLNAAIGQMGDFWKLIEVGNVYPS